MDTAAALPASLTATAPRSLHVPSLDGLRALSFFIVFLSHAGIEKVPGGFGVTVFFFLSGYLITTLMRVEVETSGGVNLKHFYLRRALRILPPFYLVLVLALGLNAVGIAPGDVRPEPVAAQVFHVSNYWITFHGWDGVVGGTGVYWSLAVEEHFYIVFPALFIFLHRRGFTGRAKSRVFLAICLLVLLWRCVLVFGLHPNVERTFLCSDTRIDSILFGCALATGNNPALEPPRSAWSDKYLMLSLVAGVSVLLATFVVRDPAFRETARYTLQGAALTPVFVAAIRRPEWFKAFNWKPVRWVGTLSYSLYLMHHVALEAVWKRSTSSSVVNGGLALGLTLIAAVLMYRLVEAPCARLRKALAH